MGNADNCGSVRNRLDSRIKILSWVYKTYTKYSHYNRYDSKFFLFIVGTKESSPWYGIRNLDRNWYNVSAQFAFQNVKGLLKNRSFSVFQQPFY